jgi:hypothetical protein
LQLTNEEAAELVRLILDRLQQLNAADVLLGIDESRRLGIEETVEMPTEGTHQPRKSKQPRPTTVRRRPPNEQEMLRLILDELRQRLVVLPAIARQVQKEMKGREVRWRVDTEFVSPDRSGYLEARLPDLLPSGVEQIAPLYDHLREMLPDIVRAREE